MVTWGIIARSSECKMWWYASGNLWPLGSLNTNRKRELGKVRLNQLPFSFQACTIMEAALNGSTIFLSTKNDFTNCWKYTLFLTLKLQELFDSLIIEVPEIIIKYSMGRYSPTVDVGTSPLLFYVRGHTLSVLSWFQSTYSMKVLWDDFLFYFACLAISNAWPLWFL